MQKRRLSNLVTQKCSDILVRFSNHLIQIISNQVSSSRYVLSEHWPEPCVISHFVQISARTVVRTRSTGLTETQTAFTFIYCPSRIHYCSKVSLIGVFNSLVTLCPSVPPETGSKSQEHLHDATKVTFISVDSCDLAKFTRFNFVVWKKIRTCENGSDHFLNLILRFATYYPLPQLLCSGFIKTLTRILSDWSTNPILGGAFPLLHIGGKRAKLRRAKEFTQRIGSCVSISNCMQCRNGTLIERISETRESKSLCHPPDPLLLCTYS